MVELLPCKQWVGGLQNANLRVSENGIIQGGGAVMDGGVSANSQNATALNNGISHGVGGASVGSSSAVRGGRAVSGACDSVVCGGCENNSSLNIGITLLRFTRKK